MLRLALFAILQLWLINYTYGVVPQITKLNVQCDRAGMKVVVDFDTPFNGIIFSKGHFNDPNCRYVNPNSRRTNYMFFIPSTQCGTMSTEARRDGSVGFKNVIIIQNDPEYQEVWDMARKISCDWVTRIDKYVTFAPFGVDMLGIKEISFPGDTVDCWMDIQRGKGPFAPTIAGVVPIGEQITIAIYIRDKDRSFDVHVKDCYAYDSPDYKNPKTRVIQITDARGCPIKEKLVRGFFRTKDVRNSGATIIAYGVINAFKFPERMDVFLACNVEVCKGGCDNPCQPEVAVGGMEPVIQGMETPPIGQIPDETPPIEQMPQMPDSQEPDSQVPDSDRRMDPSDTTTATPDEDDDAEPTTATVNGTDDETTNGGTEEGTSGGNGDDDEEETSEDESSTTTTTTTTPASDANGDEDDEAENGNSDSAGNGSKEEGTNGDSEDSDTDDTEADKNGSAENGGTADESDTTESTDDEEESRSGKQVSATSRKNGKANKSGSIKSGVKSAKIKSSNTRSAKVVANRKSNANTRRSNTKNNKIVKNARIVNSNKNRSSSNKKLSDNRVSTNKNKRKASSAPPNQSRAKKSQLISESTHKTRKQIRSKRSIFTTSGNATFADMTHSISIISPIEDFDDKELELWETAKYEQNRVCVSVIGLILSSFTLIGLFVILSVVLLITYGRLRKKYEFKCDF